MSIVKSAFAASAAALLGISLAPAAHAETTTNGCVVSGPNQINVYRQDMNFSVTVTPAPGMDRSAIYTHVDLVSPADGLENYTSINHSQSDRGMFTFDVSSGAHNNLRYGWMYEEVSGGGYPVGCGTVRRPIYVKAATRPYASATRSGARIKVNGTIEHYNKDFTSNYYYYGRWERIAGTYLDFQRLENGRWVTKKSVRTDARGNATTGWMSAPRSTWRVQYRGGWALQATATAAVTR